MAVRKHLVAALWMSAGVAAALPVAAQPRPPAPAHPAHPPAQATQPPSATDARRAYDEGTAQYAAGHYPEALASFRRAYELRSNPVVLLPIIECHRQLGQVSDELATIEHYLHDAPNAPTRAQLEARVTTLRALPATWHVSSTPPGAAISVDGTPSGHVAPADIQLPSGHHVLTLTLDGYTSSEQQADVTPGEAHPLDVTLVAAPPVPVAPVPVIPSEPLPPAPVAVAPVPVPSGEGESHGSNGWTPVVITTAIVAGGAFVASAVFGGLALSDSNSYSTAPTQSLYNSGRREALFCDIGWIVGALATGVGVVVFLSSRGHHSDSESPSHTATSWLRLSPSGAGVAF